MTLQLKDQHRYRTKTRIIEKIKINVMKDEILTMEKFII